MAKRLSESSSKLSFLPSVSEADQYLRGLGLPNGKPVREAVERVLGDIRVRIQAAGSNPEARAHDAIAAGPGTQHPLLPLTREAVLDAIVAAVRQPAPRQLRRVINATGVVVHTNLGRAPLRTGLFEEVLPLLGGYSNLEYDLGTGRRGERGGRVPELLATLAEAEAGLAVNNNAAAVLLLLSALAREREVIVSRGELVEIGGSFRIPDIMRESGARLVEVGTTNRTRLADYAAAITTNTAALLKVHRSNFSQSGFVEETSVKELSELARERGLAVWHDWGSGSLYRFNQPALRGHTTAADEIRAGADVVTFSGDKLLGAVQAGLVVGRSESLRAMAKHPLYRSVRVDKVRLVLLERALQDYQDIASLRARNPSIDLLERTIEEMQPLATELITAMGSHLQGRDLPNLVRDYSVAGGGAAPDARLETLCMVVTPHDGDAAALAGRLRSGDPPVIVRVQDNCVLLDLRTVMPQDVTDLARRLREAKAI
jgi:L-seryl-tRNA(Ser) seleniumtransferase